VLRDRKPQTLNVTLDALQEQGAAPSPDDNTPDNAPGRTPGLGIELGDSPNGGAQIQRVAPGSDAQEEVQPGDVIVEVNRVPVANAGEAVKQVQATPVGSPILLKVRDRKGARTHYVALERK
jgi:serine protease Do